MRLNNHLEFWDLIKIKKNAVENPTALKIIHITMIWYRTAMRGEIPERICPVIIPGRDTKPTANKELVMGINAARSAIPRDSK